MANTSEHMSIRLPKNLAERVRARAGAEGRSVSGMMTRLVQHAMEGRVDQPPHYDAGVDNDVIVKTPLLIGRGDGKPGKILNPHAQTCKCLMCKPPKG